MNSAISSLAIIALLIQAVFWYAYLSNFLAELNNRFIVDTFWIIAALLGIIVGVIANKNKNTKSFQLLLSNIAMFMGIVLLALLALALMITSM
jgi:hypothetical protein